MLFITRQEALQKEREITVLREKTESLSGQLVTVHNHSHLEENGLSHDHLAQENITLTEQIKELEDKLKLSKVPRVFVLLFGLFCKISYYWRIICGVHEGMCWYMQGNTFLKSMGSMVKWKIC